MKVAFLNIIAKILGFFVSRIHDKANDISSGFSNWRSGNEIRKESRRQRASIIESVDNLSVRDSTKSELQ